MNNSNSKSSMSRRTFLGIAGGAAGVATMGSMRMLSAFSENHPEIDVEKNENPRT